MARKRYTAEAIICHPRTVEIEADKASESQTPAGISASPVVSEEGGVPLLLYPPVTQRSIQVWAPRQLKEPSSCPAAL